MRARQSSLLFDPISATDIQARVQRDNPWWSDHNYIIPETDFGRRVYYQHFKSLATNFAVKRAAILLGPRRVGKTVMAKQLIGDAIANGMDPKSILYASIDAPIYSGTRLEKFLGYMPKDYRGKTRMLIFDEIQYLKDWQRHLKDLVDSYPNVKFVATGSAAAALRLQSKESGAGRFSHFILPPLTFYEFLVFSEREKGLVSQEEGGTYKIPDIEALNTAFIDYLNFGGYPEAVTNADVRKNAEQFIRSDIVDKVLLKDLPSLYGIQEIPELNRLFAVLAYNAGNEATLENLSRSSGISKPTITKYVQYLESAFLVIKLSTVDDNCKSMSRERNFKVYLNNPSMRAALFAPVSADDTELIGKLTECAIFSQMQHSVDFPKLRYARWKKNKNEGEVDFVLLGGPSQSPLWAGEVKWSDRLEKDFGRQTQSLATFASNHKRLKEVFFTTRTIHKTSVLNGKRLKILPSAFFCYAVGRDITSELAEMPDPTISESSLSDDPTQSNLFV